MLVDRCKVINLPTHGSITKAGKVRQSTPIIEPIIKKKLNPKANNRRKYKLRVIYGRNIFREKKLNPLFE